MLSSVAWAHFSFAAGARPICPPTSPGATCWRVSAATPSPSCCRRPTVPARRLAPSTSGARSSRRSSVPDCRASPSPSELPPFPSTRRMPMRSSLPPGRRSTRQSKPGGIGSSAGPESCRQAAVWIRRRCGMKPTSWWRCSARSASVHSSPSISRSWTWSRAPRWLGRR